MEVVVMVVAITTTFLVMIPRAWRRRAFGYVNLSDLLAILFVVSHFMAPGAAASSLYIGVLAMLGSTITLRFCRAQFGCEKLELNGDSSISTVVAGVMTQGVRWIRAIAFSLVNGGTINRPTPLEWEWVEDLEPAENFWEGNSRFWSTI